MVERLRLLIKHYNLSASSFADKIDVPRSSISHLLSGRNRPSLDFVMKVVDAFNDVDIDWIVYGKGDFPKKRKKQIASESNILDNDTVSVDLFSSQQTKKHNKVSLESRNSDRKDHKQKSIQNKSDDSIVIKTKSNDATIEKEETISANLSNRITNSKTKKVIKVVLLYNDGSFEEYNP